MTGRAAVLHGTPFPARFPGRCYPGEHSIDVGDPIVSRDREWGHPDCWDSHTMLTDPDPASACPRCFTVPALNGACSCP